MEPIGTFLRREREDRGLSLDEIADVTRIPSQSLALLEEGRFESLPGDPFVRGFLRAYAYARAQDRPEQLSSRVTLRLPAV